MKKTNMQNWDNFLKNQLKEKYIPLCGLNPPKPNASNNQTEKITNGTKKENEI